METFDFAAFFTGLITLLLSLLGLGEGGIFAALLSAIGGG